MIQIDKGDVRGYLRTGRVLQKFEEKSKQELALRVYAKGLRSVPTSQEHFKVLQMAHDKLTRALSPPKSVDPFTVLPVELVEAILGYLEFHQMVRCIPVSKQWKRFIVGRESAWQTIDFSKATRPVRKMTISAYLNRGQDRIKHFTFHRHSDPESLLAVLKLAKELETLTFLDTEFGTHSLISAFTVCEQRRGRLSFDWLKSLVLSEHTTVTPDGAAQIMSHCSGLTLAHIEGIDPTATRSSGQSMTWTGSWPNLEDLRLGNSVCREGHFEPWNLAELFKRVPKLKSFHLRDIPVTVDMQFPDWPPLRSLSVQTRCLRLAAELPLTLQELRVHGGLTIQGMHTCPELALFKDLRHVEAQSNFTVHLMRYLGGLDGVVLPWTRLILRYQSPFGGSESWDHTFPQALAHLPHLEELDMSRQAVDDVLMEQIPRLLPKLRIVRLMTTNITGVTVKSLVLGLRELETLDISNCPNVSFDAVEWARSHGVQVKHQMTKEGQAKGKRVRPMY